MTQTLQERPPTETPARSVHSTLLGVSVLKWVFALEYALQGLVNPFQGMTYQPFLSHLRLEYGLSEAATQQLFAKSYLAWSAKPIIGFLVDAYGRTRTLLISLFLSATLGFLVAPLIDRTARLFFGSMFALSLVLAATDVVVDRATVLSGEQESRESGRSKSTAVGLNQAICWTAVYGSSIAAAVLGGFAADHMPFALFVASLAIVPAIVLLVAFRLPADLARPTPLKRSVHEFWRGLQSGPLLAVMLFYFLFNFQPSMGPLWTTHLLADLHFSRSQVGIGDAAAYAGSFVGVLVFAWKGVHWHDRVGHKRLFALYILVNVALSLTQFSLIDPWFSRVAAGVEAMVPGFEQTTVRLLYLCCYNFAQGITVSVVRMSTFSLVGTVVPTTAAGSLFAGFMSIANLGAALSYSTGSWLYEHGREWSVVRSVEAWVLDLPVRSEGHLSINTLLVVSSLSYLLSLACVHVLPDQRQTAAGAGEERPYPGPERWDALPKPLRRAVNLGAITGFATLFGGVSHYLELDVVSALIMSLFSVVWLRKLALDGYLRAMLCRRTGTTDTQGT